MLSDRDFRKLSPSTRVELRRVAVHMVLLGKSRIEVAEAVGVNRRFVGAWVRAFEAAGKPPLPAVGVAAVRVSRRRSRSARKPSSGS